MNPKGPIQIDLGIPSIFAKGVGIEWFFEESKDKKQTSALVTFIFIDPTVPKALTKITISYPTAQAVKEILEKGLKNATNILSGKKKASKQKIKEGTTIKAVTYTG